MPSSSEFSPLKHSPARLPKPIARPAACSPSSSIAKRSPARNSRPCRCFAPAGVAAGQILVVGLGERGGYDAGMAYRAAATAAKSLAGKPQSRVAYFLDPGDSALRTEAAIAGAMVGCQGQDLYRAEKKRTPPQGTALVRRRRRGDRTRPDHRRKRQSRPPSDQRAAARHVSRVVRRQGRGGGQAIWFSGRGLGSGQARKGALRIALGRQSRFVARAAAGDSALSRGQRRRSAVGVGRQRGDVRFRRPLAQTVRLDAHDEMRYVGGGDRARGDSGHRPAQAAGERRRPDGAWSRI